MMRGQDLAPRTARREARRRLIELRYLARVHRKTSQMQMQRLQMPPIESQLPLKSQCSRMRSISNKRQPQAEKNKQNTPWSIQRREKKASLRPLRLIHRYLMKGPHGTETLRRCDLIKIQYSETNVCLYCSSCRLGLPLFF